MEKDVVSEEKTGQEQEQIETIYVEGSGLFKLIKDNLSKADALVVQGEMENGKYGLSTHWYRKDEGGGKYSVWQRLLRESDIDSDGIKACKSSAIQVVKGDEVNIPDVSDEIKEISGDLKKIKDTTNEIYDGIADRKWQIGFLYVLVSGLYTFGGIYYLKYIRNLDNTTIGLIIVAIFAFIMFLLWFKCEVDRCEI